MLNPLLTTAQLERFFLLTWAVGIWGGAERDEEEEPLEHDVSWGAWKI